MQEAEIKQIIDAQRAYFFSGATLNVNSRIAALTTLRHWILANEKAIAEAVHEDLGKSAFETYMCETGMVLSELSYMLGHVRGYAREKRVLTPLHQYVSRSYKEPSPYGVVLIMSPWNYPFMLTVEPMVDALAAGNTVVVKPSAYSPATSALIARMVKECFDARLVSVVTGGRAENQALLKAHFDYIFFTGSQAVGKDVMRQASEHLTPVTLELGGKSPCIVDKTANIKLTAKRLVFGKYLNLGQTCVAPDYVYCDKAIKDELIAEVKRQIRKQFGKDILSNPDYGKMINKKHFDRVCGLIDMNKVVFGGHRDEETLKIEPTVMDNVTFEDAVMQEEIFGPVMPVLTYDSLDQAIEKLNAGQHPLALYMFTTSKANAKKVTKRVGFGGGCINDTIIHLATSEMSFGGFGESGMGAYHGKDGFDTFTHYKSIVDKKTWLDLPMRYQPYKGLYDKMIHIFMR